MKIGGIYKFGRNSGGNLKMFWK